MFPGYCVSYQKGLFQGIYLAAFINLPLSEPEDRKMSDICVLAFSYSGQGCPQPVRENIKELAKLKHFVKERHICKVNPSALSGCSLPASQKTATKKNSFSVFTWREDHDSCQPFRCLQLGLQAVSIMAEEISKKPPSLRANLALEPAEPHQLSWFSHFLSFCPGRVSLCPNCRPSPALLQQQKPVGRVARVWVQPSWRELWELPSREELSLPAMPLCSSIFCHLCLAQASLKSYLTQSGMLLSRIMGESGSDIRGYRPNRCTQKGGK